MKAGCIIAGLITGMLLQVQEMQAQPRANRFEVIAYYSGDGLALDTYPIHKLTQIIFCFLNLKDDTLHFGNEAKKQALQRVVALKKSNPNLKVLVSLGGWSGCATCSPVFARAESRLNFARSVKKIMDTYQADGIDLDWEYPTIPGYPGHPYSPNDKDNFTDLIVQIRKAIGTEGQLSFAAGGFTEFLERAVDWHAIMPYINRVNLMTYDLVNGYSTQTGHHTALYSQAAQKESTDHCVQWLLQQGMPAEKLIIGGAFYARIWEKVNSDNWGLFKQGVFKQSLDYRNFQYMDPDSGWTHQWDDIALAPYAYHKTQNLFASYDNGMSLYEKVLYARRFRLGGIMFWELLCDTPEGALLQTLADAVEKTQQP